MAKILCIDDETDFRQDLAEFLAEEGYTVIEAQDGEQGLARIIAEQPDLVICDRSMPKMSGVELLQTLRDKHPELESMPFVFLTALDDRRDKHATAHLNPSRYLSKPIDFDQLQETIERLLKD